MALILQKNAICLPQSSGAHGAARGGDLTSAAKNTAKTRENPERHRWARCKAIQRFKAIQLLSLHNNATCLPQNSGAHGAARGGAFASTSMEKNTTKSFSGAFGAAKAFRSVARTQAEDGGSSVLGAATALALQESASRLPQKSGAHSAARGVALTSTVGNTAESSGGALSAAKAIPPRDCKGGNLSVTGVEPKINSSKHAALTTHSFHTAKTENTHCNEWG